jgi:ABC-type Fe3+-hydroxamate transport system substrate-binding protein
MLDGGAVPALKVTDDLGRVLVFVHPPQRVVSLVPSDTYSVIALGAADRLVGRTTYCEHGDGVPTVGGTKNVDVDAVLALAPHRVIANQEENTRKAVEALAARVLPRRVDQGISHLARLARILGVTQEPTARDLIRRGYGLAAAVPVGPRAFVPIWMDPLMTINADTFGSDVLARIGIANAFGDRLRLYPLAADLGKTEPEDSSGRDVRYPRVSREEVITRGADVVVLPDEPYAFSEADEAVLRRTLPKARIVRVSGKDLFWYGAWTIDALPRLAAQFAN